MIIKLDKKFFFEFFIEFIYLAIIFLIPIYFSWFFSTSNPFELQKIFLFKSFLWILSFLIILKLFSDKKYLNYLLELIKKYFYIPILILFFLLIVNFWSINQWDSFWGSLDRQMGWLSYFSFFIFSIIVATYISSSHNKKQKISNIILTIIISSSIVSAYAIFQYLGVDFLIWEEPASLTKRAMSTLGQPNFLGSFLLLTIPLAIYSAINYREKRYKIILIFSIIIQFLALIFSGSRGAWVSLIVSSLLFFICFYFKKNNKVFYLGVGAIILFILFLFIGNFNFNKRFKSLLIFNEGSSSARVILWSSSLNFASNNFWGIGLENQREVLINYYQVDWATFSKVNVVFDRSHNILLDTILTSGFLGLAFWLFFYFFIFKIIFNNIKNKNNPLLSKFLFLSLFSYLFSLLFNFSVVVTEIYFWLLIAIIFSLNIDHIVINKNIYFFAKLGKIKLLKHIILFIFLILSLIGINRQIKNIKSDYYFFEAKKAFYQGEVPTAVLTFSYFRDENPVFNRYYYDFISMIFDNFINFRDESSRFLSLEEIKKIDNIISKRSSKSSFEFVLARAQIEALLGNFSESEKHFDVLRQQSFYYPNFYFKEGKMRELQRDFLTAQNNYYQVLELLPSDDSVNGDINLKALQRYRFFIEKELNNLIIN